MDKVKYTYTVSEKLQKNRFMCYLLIIDYKDKMHQNTHVKSIHKNTELQGTYKKEVL